ncbi:MAG TPA: hypothetical protein VFF72_08200, partial [Caldimonas sp.]|nr:hypothetical protein [Caldimonas sp.]
MSATTFALPREAVEALAGARHSNPFQVLGPHETDKGRLIRTFLPGAVGVDVLRRADGRPIGELRQQN